MGAPFGSVGNWKPKPGTAGDTPIMLVSRSFWLGGRYCSAVPVELGPSRVERGPCCPPLSVCIRLLIAARGLVYSMEGLAVQDAYPSMRRQRRFQCRVLRRLDPPRFVFRQYHHTRLSTSICGPHQSGVRLG